MMKLATTLCTITLCLTLDNVRAQTPHDIQAFSTLVQPPTQRASLRSDIAKSLRASNNELKTLATLAYWGYKFALTSQDGPQCVFGPSCGGYAFMAIQRRGIVFGTLAAFDRLTRCNALASDVLYIKDEKTGLLLDAP